jgi:hypothetical protein
MFACRAFVMRWIWNKVLSMYSGYSPKGKTLGTTHLLPWLFICLYRPTISVSFFVTVSSQFSALWIFPVMPEVHKKDAMMGLKFSSP